MKFYIASSFALKMECIKVQHQIRENLTGCSIPDIWWNIDAKEIPAENDEAWHSLPEVKAIAERHWKTIRECDAVILVSHPTEPRKFTGANIEVGYALGRGIPVFSVGHLERSGMYSPVIRCKDVDELIKSLRIFTREAR